MARPGPPPKNTKHGHNGAGWTDVPNTPYSGPGAVRELPSLPGMIWYPQVEVWWETVRVMPHCRLWEPADWLFAIETALLKNNFYGELFGGTVHTTMATEIRRREDQMGMTLEARRKNGIRYVDPAQVAQAAEEPDSMSDDDGADHQTRHADWIQDDGRCTACGDNVKPIGSAKSRRARLTG